MQEMCEGGGPVLSLFCGPKRRECESCVFWVVRDQGGHLLLTLILNQ